ncbi:9595_t:CDS:2 [Funneliformis geosporum]|nr:9595_t:CDS:2 [Funneliformis geosporum]
MTSIVPVKKYGLNINQKFNRGSSHPKIVPYYKAMSTSRSHAITLGLPLDNDQKHKAKETKETSKLLDRWVSAILDWPSYI